MPDNPFYPDSRPTPTPGGKVMDANRHINVTGRLPLNTMTGRQYPVGGNKRPAAILILIETGHTGYPPMICGTAVKLLDDAGWSAAQRVWLKKSTQSIKNSFFIIYSRIIKKILAL